MLFRVCAQVFDEVLVIGRELEVGGHWADLNVLGGRRRGIHKPVVAGAVYTNRP